MSRWILGAALLGAVILAAPTALSDNAYGRGMGSRACPGRQANLCGRAMRGLTFG